MRAKIFISTLALLVGLSAAAPTMAGVSENKARQAAEAVADINSPLARIETKVFLVQWVISGIGIGVLMMVLRNFWGS